MPTQRQYGTVNLYGVGSPDNGQGQKQIYDKGRNQQLSLSPDLFRMNKESDFNPMSTNGEIMPPNRHERIKELLSQGKNRKEAVGMAKRESKGNISKAEVYRYKYQNTGKNSPFSSQSQETPY